MIFPNSFEIFGQTFTVVLKKNLIKKHGALGRCNSEKGWIQIQDPEYTDVSREVLEQTFFHELMHAILDSIGQEELSANENLVDLMGSCMYQAIKTMD